MGGLRRRGRVPVKIHDDIHHYRGYWSDRGAEYEKHKNVDRRFAMCDFNPFFVYAHNTIPTLRFSVLLSVRVVPQAEVALV
jgi:hypothetical protein